MEAAKELDFERATELRDILFEMKMEQKKGNNFYIISFYSGIIFLLETVITGLTSFAVLTVAF